MTKKEAFKPNTQLVISKKMHDMILGTLLGDGSLGTGPGTRTWSYRALHGEDQKNYLFHKYEILHDFCSTAPSQQEVANAAGKKRTRWYFNTRRMGVFKYYGDLFYIPTGNPERPWIKRVPPGIEDLLNPTVLAYWYMDDGDQKWRGHSRAVRISIQSFTRPDCELLQSALQKKYGLVTTLQKADLTKKKVQQYRLYFPTKCYDTLKSLIYSELLPSMLYKFPE